MSYQVRLRRVVQRQMDRLAEYGYEIVGEAIAALGQAPRPRGVKKLAESGLWRIRAGPYRIVYSIDDKESSVIVVRVVRRTENTYKRL